MKQRKLRNRLLELIQERERKYGRRMKQNEVAEFAKVSEHTISKWIKNKVTRFDADMVEALCDYFNCDVGDLLYFEWVETGIPPEKIND